MRSIATLLDTLPDETGVLPGHMGPDDARPRARDQPVPARTRRPVSKQIQAPRGTYDVLPALADERARLEHTAAKILERAGLRPDRDADLRGHAPLQPHGGGGDGRRPEGDVHASRTAAGDSLTLRPRARRRSVRAYLEHGMHKEPQPVKLWYLSQLLPLRAPAGRPLPPVLADRRRGDRVGRPRGGRGADPAARPSCWRRSARATSSSCSPRSASPSPARPTARS